MFRARPPALPPLRLSSGGEVFSPAERAAECTRHIDLALGVPSFPNFDVFFFEEVERAVCSRHGSGPGANSQ